MNNMKESSYIGGRKEADVENSDVMSVRDEKNVKSIVV
jgi:hypothetical protein